MAKTVEAYEPFDHARTGELERLKALAEISDSATEATLASLVRPGWRCLDVGAGAGAASLQLQGLVGAAGTIVASDIDTKFLQPLATRGIEVVEHDITAAPVAGPEFDLVVARFVFEWIPDREAALRHMVESLRPGGIAVVEGPDWGTRILDAEPAVLDTFAVAAVKFIAARGCETDTGRRLPGRFDALGLKNVAGRTVSSLLRGGNTAAARWALNTLDGVGPAMVEQGMVGEAELDAARKGWADPGARCWGPPAVAVWGWKGAD